MSLSPKARALLDAYRATETLSSAHEEQLLHALRARLPSAGEPDAHDLSGSTPVPTSTAFSALKLAGVASLVLAGSGALWLALRPAAPEPSSAPPASAPVHTPSSEPSAAPSVQAPPVPTTTLRSSVASTAPDGGEVAPRSSTKANRASADVQRPSVAAPNPTAAANPAPRVTGVRVSGVEAELRLLQTARALLGARRARDALAVLTDLERQFPKGKLLDARALTRMQALCAAGERARARAEATQFLASHPNSAFAARVRAVCLD